jgi:Uma2 family endonuclease
VPEAVSSCGRIASNLSKAEQIVSEGWHACGLAVREVIWHFTIVQTARAIDFLSVEEYLEGEEISTVKHEYVGGVVYAMSGASDAHNTIALNIAAALKGKLRGGQCRVFMSDVKARLADDEFYYPDVMVCCDPRDVDPRFKKYPKVIVEVLSESTERIDRGEKFLKYRQSESLEEYILVAQSHMEVLAHRRSNGWKAEVLRGPGAELRVKSIEFSMQLGDIYDGLSV